MIIKRKRLYFAYQVKLGEIIEKNVIILARRLNRKVGGLLDKKKSSPKSSKNELSQPHDVTFKKLFGETEIAKNVIEKNLPQEVLEQLDMDSLERIDGSFVNKELKETFSDLLYRVRINNRDAYIALLWEHKSYADKFAVFQVAGYILDIWRKVIKDGKDELPVVIPIVVYHGKSGWNYKTDIKEMIPDFEILPEYLKQMLPIIKHEFINITSHTEEDIQEYEPVTRMVIRSFKYIFRDQDELIKAFLISLEEVQLLLTEEELNYYLDTLLIYYSAANKNLTEEVIMAKIQELGGKGEKIMTILQEREQRGIEEGIELGMQKGMEKGIEEGLKITAKTMIVEGEPTDRIMKYTRLTEEEIEKIKKEMIN